ncbi:MAG: DUF6526 family protein [Bacilli bacterium]
MREQSYRNHTRIDPVFHYVAMPLALINFLGSLVHLAVGFSWLAGWMAISSFVLLLALVKTRGYSKKVQDRVIRMEENFRHYVLTGAPLDANLTTSQIIALRFASDDEFPVLCERTLRENLNAGQVKETIRSWRADWFRV